MDRKEMMEGAPLLEALSQYINQEYLPFHMPGHKQGKAFDGFLKTIFGDRCLQFDLTEVAGLDDLSDPISQIKEAQQLAATLCQSKKAHFLVNGVTAGIQAGMMTLAEKKKIFYFPRHGHKSLYAAQLFTDIQPCYYYPQVDQEWGIATERFVLPQLEQGQDPVFLGVYPTYHGLCFDLKKLLKEHKKNFSYVFLDEAHGAHFLFSDFFPAAGLSLGADMVAQGWHKTMGSLTQTGMILNNNPELFPEKYLKLIQSSSPSFLLMASLDAARQQWSKKRKVFLEKLIQNIKKARCAIAEIKGIDLLVPEDKFDAGKIVIKADKIGLNGLQLANILQERYGILVEMAEINSVTLMLTLGDDEASVNCLLVSLKDLAQRYRLQKPLKRDFDYQYRPQEQGLLMAEAFKRGKKRLNLAEAVGLPVGDFLTPYPPGIPLLVPGEILKREMLEHLQEMVQKGIRIQGIFEGTIEVVE